MVLYDGREFHIMPSNLYTSLLALGIHVTHDEIKNNKYIDNKGTYTMKNNELFFTPNTPIQSINVDITITNV